MFYCCGISEIGNTRSNNEDAFMINNIILSHSQLESNMHAPFIVAVADGVAGENNGAKAASLSLELLGNIKLSSKTDLRKKIMDIHENIRSYGINHEGSLNMQTTLCALAVDENDDIRMINVGDSRLYRYDGRAAMQISKDQSLVQLLVDLGKITPKESAGHNQRNIILSSIGNIEQSPEPQVEKLGRLATEEILLICSDGLSDYVTEDMITIILAKKIPLRKKLSELISAALKNGSRDNITAVAVTVAE